MQHLHPEPETQRLLRTAGWLWLGYLVALAFIDWLMAPIFGLWVYYVVNGFAALGFLGLDRRKARQLLDQSLTATRSGLEETRRVLKSLRATPLEELGLRLVARGLNNPEIAARLSLAEGTVRNHVSAIMAKLEVADRTQAAVIAIQHGLGEDGRSG